MSAILAQRLRWQRDAHGHALARCAVDVQAPAGDGQQGAMGEQATAGASGGTGGGDAYAIVGNQYFKLGILGTPGGLEGEA